MYLGTTLWANTRLRGPTAAPVHWQLSAWEKAWGLSKCQNFKREALVLVMRGTCVVFQMRSSEYGPTKSGFVCFSETYLPACS